MKYIIVDKESNKVMGVYDESPTFDEEAQTVVEFDGEVPEVEIKEYNDSVLCYDGTKFWTEFTPKQNEVKAARYAAREKCKANIANFEYKGVKVDLSRQNMYEYMQGVTMALLLPEHTDKTLPLVLRFVDGDYVFNTIDEVKEFYLAAAGHITACNNARKAELDRIDELTSSANV